MPLPIFAKCAHELDQRRLDRRGKSPVELIESPLADDFAEELPAPLLGRFAFCCKLSQFLPRINPRELRVCRRMIPCVAPRRRVLGSSGAAVSVLSIFAHSGAPAAAIARVTSLIVCEVARQALELRKPVEKTVPYRSNLVRGDRWLSDHFVEELTRQRRSPVSRPGKAAAAAVGPVRPRQAAPKSPTRGFAWRPRRKGPDHLPAVSMENAPETSDASNADLPRASSQIRRSSPRKSTADFALPAGRRAYLSCECVPARPHLSLPHGVGDDGGRVTPALDVLFLDRRAIHANGADKRLGGSFAQRHERPQFLSLGAAADRIAGVGIVDQAVRQFDRAP